MSGDGRREKMCTPLPGHEGGCVDMKDAISNEAKDDDGEAIHEDWNGQVRGVRRGGGYD